MGVFEALVLLSIGLLLGIVSTLFDVMVVGAAAFLSHFALWVLFNTLLVTHVESRVKAIWWSVPFNLGFIEAYFLTTVATYESYARSLIVPLAAVALLSPLLANALWVAKREKGVFGQVLSLLIVAGTLAASFVINGALSAFDWVVCAIVALYLMVIPTRRLSITRARRSESAASEAARVANPERDEYERGVGAERRMDEQVPLEDAFDANLPEEKGERPARGRLGRFGRGARAEGSRRVEQGEKTEAAKKERRAPQPTKRTGRQRGSERSMSLPFGLSGRRGEDVEDSSMGEQSRSERTRSRRSRRERREESYDDSFAPATGMSTLGTVRPARPSSRSRR